MSNLKKIILLFSIIILLTSGYFYRLRALDFKFTDEEDNFAIGKYVSKGERIYQDIISNHQPLTYVFSSLLENLTHPQNGYLLLVRHREAIIIWSIVWSLLLVFTYGWISLIFILIYELTKFHLLGNLFLAESFVVYPLIYFLGLVFKERLSNLQIFLAGLSFGFSIFLLEPIWPALIFCLILLGYKQKKHLLVFGEFFLPGLAIPLILTLIYSDIFRYFYFTIFANLTYTIPSYQNESFVITFIKSFLSPIISFLPNPQTPTLGVIRIFSLVLLICNFILIRTKQFNKLILISVLLGLLNLRFITPGTEGYSGFHLLPWYSSLIFLSLLLIDKLEKRFTLNKLNLILIGAAIILSFNTSSNFFQKTDVLKSYYVNYSTDLSTASTIKIMKNDNDTLFVSPNTSLIYWGSDVNHLPKLYGDYTWMSGFKPINNQVIEAFEKNPPTYFYCDNCKGLILEKYLFKYRVVKKNKQPNHLYVLENKVKQLTKSQLDLLNDQQISF